MSRIDRPKLLLLAASLAVLAVRPAEAQINLSPGDVALIGWVDNGSPNDVFTLVALADLPAGTTIYFTDNGWDGAAGAFRNTNGAGDGNGNEGLLRWTANATVPAGTIFSTSDAANPSFTWTSAGAIPGATSGTFGLLDLTQSGDQVYAFQQDTGTNPLNTGVQMHLFVLDDTGAFENATSTGTGGIPPGLSAAAGTALTFPQSGTGQDFMAFRTSVLPGGTKADWLAAIESPSNWTFASSGTLPSGTINVGVAALGYFCYGDGTLATACPCGNSGATGHGCDNSAVTGGAQLSATGAPSPDTIALASSGELPAAATIFLQGDQSLSSGVVFGDGLRCAGGALRKIGLKIASGGVAAYPQAGDLSISARSAALGDPLAPGAVRFYQTYYRDPDMSFCPNPPGSSWNVSNAVQIAW